MSDILDNKNWSKWESFPDPRKQEYIFAPFGYGVYQLYNKADKIHVLFGRGNNLAYRMTSLLPEPYGQGKRDNESKRIYVLENIAFIKYRTIPFSNENKMKEFELELKKLRIHLFNS